MKTIAMALVMTAVMLGGGSAARAEGEARASPHETVSATVGGKKITITYGRPYKKGRVIFGKAGGAQPPLVPWGEVWRTGADEATTLTTDGDIKIGGVKVKKGTYALFTIPGDKQWTLVLNKVANQWGAYKYDKKKDLGRTGMMVGVAAQPVEQLTITVEQQGKEGTLRIAWDTAVAAVTIFP